MSFPAKVYDPASSQWLNVEAAAKADVDRTWQPAHNKLLASTGVDPVRATSFLALAGAFVWVARMWVPETVTVANFELGISVAGATLTASQNFAGIYNASGALIAKTADQATAWQSTGMKTAALTAEAGQSLTLPGGPGVWIYGAILSNGTTQPSPMMPPTQSIAAALNHKLAATDGWRGAFGGGALTALPSTLPALTAHQYLFFMGLS